MPWFPDFVAAAELARRETRAAGQADPASEYFAALDTGDARTLQTVWPGQVVVFDPRAGEIRGQRQLRRFIKKNQAVFAGRRLHTEIVASTSVGGRAVVEILAHLHGGEADADEEVVWPVAVVAEALDDVSVVFRTYCSQWPVDGHRHVRSPILEPGIGPPGGVIERYEAALDTGDTDAIVGTFSAAGYLREAIGPHRLRRGPAELRDHFAACFSVGGGIGLQRCAVTDDGVRCAVEYNYIRWGPHDIPAQAGIAVYERSPDGLLAAVRNYDDVERPVGPLPGNDHDGDQ